MITITVIYINAQNQFNHCSNIAFYIYFSRETFQFYSDFECEILSSQAKQSAGGDTSESNWHELYHDCSTSII